MKRRSRHLVVLVVAVATASLASFFMYRVAVAPAQLGAQQPQPVVVAARSLTLGTPVTEQDVKIVRWPADSPVPGSIGNLNEVVNRGLLVAVRQNEPITSDKLAATQAGSGLPPAIPPGMRAMSVKVNDVIGVAGFVVPGSRVDVVVTMRRGEGGVTRTVANNVQVLLVGTRQDQENRQADTKPKDSTVATLMVTPKDAELIALAQSEGQIMLALRNPLDTEPTVTAGAKTEELLGRPEPPSPAPPVVKAPPPRRAVAQPKPEPTQPTPPQRMVEAVRAGKRTQEAIQEGGNGNGAGNGNGKEPSKEVIK
jgi:pilus assembly protein CpaB